MVKEWFLLILQKVIQQICNPLEWLASYFLSQSHPWIKCKGYEEKRKWSPNQEPPDCHTNSPCQLLYKMWREQWGEYDYYCNDVTIIISKWKLPDRSERKMFPQREWFWGEYTGWQLTGVSYILMLSSPKRPKNLPWALHL